MGQSSDIRKAQVALQLKDPIINRLAGVDLVLTGAPPAVIQLQVGGEALLAPRLQGAPAVPVTRWAPPRLRP